MEGNMSTYQQILQAREHSPLRGELVKQYAVEQGISVSAAWYRLSHQDRLDPDGHFVRKSRSDRGTRRQLSQQKLDKLMLAKKALKKHPAMCLTEISALTGLHINWVSRANRILIALLKPTMHHHAPPDKSAPGTVA
jgi:hypothetical protein